MAPPADSVAAIAERFCAELEGMGVRPERMLLFGSHARHTAHEGSDFDFIVISGDWAAYGPRERLELLGVAAARILEPVQAYGVTPDEIAEHRLTPFLEHVVSDLAVPV